MVNLKGSSYILICKIVMTRFSAMNLVSTSIFAIYWYSTYLYTILINNYHDANSGWLVNKTIEVQSFFHLTVQWLK